MSDSASTQATDRGDDPERAVSLRIEELIKVFEEADGTPVRAVDDVTLDVYDGEFLVLVGPSGCGKTTLLRTIAGLEPPTEGAIIINGRDVSGLEPRERDVAMVFQNYALYPHKTVRENLAFPLEIRKYPRDEIERRVADTADLLDIPELLDRRPGDLSGGQQQRVALGRAIVRDPELFLFDEPLSNLDAKLRVQMRTELNKLHTRVGKTSVYVTHDQAEAMTLGDRVAVMRDGRLQQVAPPQEVFERPATRFVAGFIGEPPMNFFDVRIDERDGRPVIVAEGFELPLPDVARRALGEPSGDGRELVLGIRPEHFVDAGAAEAGAVPEGATFEALTRVVEPMGSYKDLALVPHGAAEDAAEFTARVSNESTAMEGEPIVLGVELSKLHLFDPETGANLLV